MKLFKKIAGAGIIVFMASTLFGFASPARAATPTLSLSSNSDGTVQVTVSGDANAPVTLFYIKTNAGLQIVALGNTNASGSLSTALSQTSYDVGSGSSVYVTTGGLSGPRSADVLWPAASTGTFSLSQTGVVLGLGQNSTITANNAGASYMYVSNNSNPPVANVNINGSQIAITAISYGSTIATVCLQSSASTCASVYITVQNGAAQSLSFSVSNVTVSPGQSVPITISGGTGTYSVLNNSNSAVIQTSLSGSVVTLTTNATSGTSAITICSSNMSSCGIINAAASTASTIPLAFSQASPTLSIGQSLSIGLSGGSSSTYYLSSNSNSAALTAAVSGATLTLTGIAMGSSTVTVCSSAGSCGSLTGTVSYTSTGGTLQLSQTNLVLLVGQVLSVTVSGGTSPYTLGYNSGAVFQASVSGNVITVSGISSGSAGLSVCSAGGACLTLNVTVNSAGTSTPVGFSQNNISLPVGGAGALTLSGAGGYYVSNSSNSSVASVQISGNTAVVTGLSAGTANISICQSGGQCGILFVTISTGSSSTPVPSFSQTAPTLTSGQVASITVYNSTTGSYYVSANSNPAVASFSLSGSALSVTGLSAGSTTAVICSTATSCAPLTVTITGAPAGTGMSLSSTSTSISIGHTYAIALSGGSGYTVASNSNPLVASVQVSGTIGTITGLSAGTTTISFCNSGAQCASFTLTVTGSSIPVPTTTPVSTLLPPGTLINDGGTIYLIASRTKVPFASMKAFTGLGYSLANVITADVSAYTASQTVLNSATQAHPDGSWIISGKVVFYVATDGYIPVPTWDIFLSNGGEAKFIAQANTADLKDPRPIVSKMAESDSRIIK